MAGFVGEGKASELEKAFYKEPEQVLPTPDKSFEEQLRDLIADFKAMPEDSLIKDVQR
jgi:hypothetical protein